MTKLPQSQEEEKQWRQCVIADLRMLQGKQRDMAISFSVLILAHTFLLAFIYWQVTK